MLDEDSWIEEFSLQIEENNITGGILSEDYKIIGFPFFNKENRMEKFESAIDEWRERV